MIFPGGTYFGSGDNIEVRDALLYGVLYNKLFLPCLKRLETESTRHFRRPNAR